MFGGLLMGAETPGVTLAESGGGADEELTAAELARECLAESRTAPASTRRLSKRESSSFQSWLDQSKISPGRWLKNNSGTPTGRLFKMNWEQKACRNQLRPPQRSAEGRMPTCDGSQSRLLGSNSPEMIQKVFYQGNGCAISH